MAAVAAGVPARMAALAGHVLVRVSTAAVGNAGLGRCRNIAIDKLVALPAPRLGQGGLRVEVRAGRVDGGLGLYDLPGDVLLDHRVLAGPVSLAPEAGLAPRRPQGSKVAAKPRLARRRRVRRRAGRAQAGFLGDGAVAVDALDLDGGTHLHLEPRVAVAVLDVVAVDAVHALFHVDVE